MRTRLLFCLLILVAAAAFGTAPSSAQLVLVDNQYYVTELRPGKDVFGVALHRGEYTKNWVHVRYDTKVSVRHWLSRARGFRDQIISPRSIFNYLRLGSRIRVQGGRDWDGSVVARRIWI